MNNIENSKLDKAVFTWFEQKRLLGDIVTGHVLQEKALLFNKMLGGPDNFAASQGWLHRFNIRHGIHSLSLQGEKNSADEEAAKKFCIDFREWVNNNDLEYENIYNADETGCNWRSLPKRTLVQRGEAGASGHKDSKERVTVLCCANATGTHKTRLLVIGKSKNPRGFKDIKKLPVHYRNQSSAWMNAVIFRVWFENVFLDEIRKKRKETGREGQVVLLLDNAPVHPKAEELNAIDPTVEVRYLPPNVTSLLQPMDQGVIEKTKKMYRRSLLRELLIEKDQTTVQELLAGEDNASGEVNRRKERKIIERVKEIKMKDCVLKIANAWECLTKENLKNAWNKLLGNDHHYNPENRVDALDIEIRAIASRIPELHDCEDETVFSWAREKNEGWEILDDAKIIESTSGNFNSEESFHDEEGEEELSDDESVNPCDTSCMSAIPKSKCSIAEALDLLKKVTSFCEDRWEFDGKDLLSLENIKEKALGVLESETLN